MSFENNKLVRWRLDNSFLYQIHLVVHTSIEKVKKLGIVKVAVENISKSLSDKLEVLLI